MYDKDKHIAVLEATNEALAIRLSQLNKRKMARNSEATNKWRRQAFYYKSRCKALARILKINELEVPNIGGTDESSN